MRMKTTEILKKVKRDYAEIAAEFSATRQKPWPEFELFKKYAKKFGPKAKILDVGCGNGRLAGALESQNYIGMDNSRALLKIAKKSYKKAKFKYGDILKIPFPAKTFELVFAIAVLHHIPPGKLQLQAIQEIKRVLKKGGRAIITVWNLWQKKYKAHIDPKTHEALIPWKKKIKRYYYAFKAAELAALLKRAGFSILKKHIKNSHNFIFVCHEKS